jgi:aspartyl-tRNA(Asn)/glutamyl-tRNA(Gln) amidotransferase subunit C
VAVTRAQVLAIAQLARLRLTDAEADLFAAQLDGILEHVAELAGADTEATAAASNVDAAPLRADEPAPDALLQPPGTLAPAWRDGFFTVPRLAAMDGGDAG